jgi:hypothetical protein
LDGVAGDFFVKPDHIVRSVNQLGRSALILWASDLQTAQNLQSGHFHFGGAIAGV